MTGVLKLIGDEYDLWIKNATSQKGEACGGLWCYKKNNTTPLAWVGLNTNSNGASYLEICSWGADAADSTKNGNMRLLSSGPLNINSHGLLSIYSVENSLSLRACRDINLFREEDEDSKSFFLQTAPSISGKTGDFYTYWSMFPGVYFPSATYTDPKTKKFASEYAPIMFDRKMDNGDGTLSTYRVKLGITRQGTSAGFSVEVWNVNQFGSQTTRIGRYDFISAQNNSTKNL